MYRLALLLCALLGLSACAGIEQRRIPPGFDYSSAAPYGIANVISTRPDLPPAGERHLARGPMIAFSGGGEMGAFGAGIVTGWTQRGDRPEFAVVTGVSTGAILALFTFLGSEYDATLTEAYTRYGTSDLLRPQVFAAALGAPALNSARGYRRLIDRYIDKGVLADLARAARRGRRLIVVTTDLDRETTVFWDLTEVAASGHPQALRLVRDVIQASSAIPIEFPPVLIPMRDAGGRSFAAMHVDGGASVEFTLFGLGAGLGQGPRPSRAYVVLNQFAETRPSATSPRMLPIARRATASLLESAVISEAARVRDAAARAGVPLRFAVVPSGFPRPAGKQMFDRDYMQALVALGQRMVRNGPLWQPDINFGD